MLAFKPRNSEAVRRHMDSYVLHAEKIIFENKLQLNLFFIFHGNKLL